jgi:transposase
MRDRDLYSKIQGVSARWHVTHMALDMPAGKVEVLVEHRGEGCCPKCGTPRPGCDTRRQRWRHLGTCQFETHLVARTS